MNEQNRSNQSSTKRKISSTARLLFFLISTFWGYLLGWAAIYIIAKHCGIDLDVGFLDISVILGSIALAAIGAVVFHSVYREYRKKKSRI